MTREEAIANLKMSDKYYLAPFTEAVKMAIEALEQEPKSEWEHDHEILKAYSDGASDILDKIRAEIDYDMREAPYIYDDEHFDELYSYQDGLEHALNIIDKYTAESEDKE